MPLNKLRCCQPYTMPFYFTGLLKGKNWTGQQRRLMTFFAIHENATQLNASLAKMLLQFQGLVLDSIKGNQQKVYTAIDKGVAVATFRRQWQPLGSFHAQ